MNVGGTRGDPHAARADMAVGDVNLAPVYGTHRIAIEHQVAVVDVKQPRSLTYDRLVTALERGSAGRVARSHRARCSRLRGADAVTGPGLEHASGSDLLKAG